MYRIAIIKYCSAATWPLSSLIYKVAIILVIANGFFFNAGAQIMIGSTQVDTLSVATGLDTPWEILWGQDNHIWFTERSGRVSLLNPETKELQLLLTINEVHEQSESGLLGMALHPDFPDSSYVFLVYNYLDGAIKERIVRYEYIGSSLINPYTLLENIGGAGNHDGSRIVISSDYKLFVTTGDATNTSTAQDLESLNGKILRLNLDGSIPDDNPIPGSYIWTWGHRNPQGLVIASNGKMYSSEHGPNNDDELNLIVGNNNYGWPDVHGYCDQGTELTFCNDSDVIEPLLAWTPTLAVAGIDYYEIDSIPELKNNILMTTLKENQLMSIQLNADGLSAESSSVWFDGWFGRLRDICVSPDGKVFIATSNRDGRGSPNVGDDRIIQFSKHHEEIQPSLIDDHQLKQGFNLYPNPMRESATIRLKDDLNNAILFLVELSGNIIFTSKIIDGSYILNKGQIPAGIYFIKVINGSGIYYQPLIIN